MKHRPPEPALGPAPDIGDQIESAAAQFVLAFLTGSARLEICELRAAQGMGHGFTVRLVKD